MTYSQKTVALNLSMTAQKLLRIAFILILACSLLLSSCNGETPNSQDPNHNQSSGNGNQEPSQDTQEPPKSPISTEQTVNLATDGFLKSKYALLLNAQTWEIVAEKNATVRFSPASLTKVMTLLVACEHFSADDLDKKLVHSQEIVDYVSSGEYAGTSFSLPRDNPDKGIYYIGDQFKVRDLLYGIGVASAADCTYMIVKEIAGSEDAFVTMMNEKASKLGLSNTHFNNAVGFESLDNYTTAAEMSTIMAYAMENELIADILKLRTENYVIKGYYTEDAVEKTYNVSLKPSINSRLKYYEEFSLTGTKLEATKTGFTTGSYLVCTVVHKTTGTRYVLVVGEADSPAATQSGMFKDTMLDIEYICNTYIP